jgi:hypothetical protein
MQHMTASEYWVHMLNFCMVLDVIRHHENETVWIRTTKITRSTSTRNASWERNDIHEWGTWELRSKYLWENLKVRDNIKNLEICSRIILKYIWKEGLEKFWTELNCVRFEVQEEYISSNFRSKSNCHSDSDLMMETGRSSEASVKSTGLYSFPFQKTVTCLNSASSRQGQGC